MSKPLSAVGRNRAPHRRFVQSTAVDGARIPPSAVNRPGNYLETTSSGYLCE